MNTFKLHYIEDVILVTLSGVPNTPQALADIFSKIGEAEINLDMISQTVPYKGHVSVCFTIGNDDFSAIIRVIGQLKSEMPNLVTEVNPGNCKIVLYSECLKTQSGVAATLFNLLAKHEIKISLITTSDVEIELLFDNATDSAKVRELLKEEFKIN